MKPYGKPFYILLFSWMFSAFGFATMLPFLSIFLTEQYALSVAEVGIFFILTAFFRSIFQVYSGEISDLIGRKNIMSYSQILRAILICIAVLCMKLEMHYIYVVSFLGLSYVCASMFQPVAQAALSDHLPLNDFIHGFSRIRVAGNFSWMLGPILAGYLVKISFSSLFLISGLFSLIGAILISRHYIDIVKLDDKRTRSNILTIAEDKLFLVFCLISFFLSITISQMFSSLSVFLSSYKKLDASLIGYIFAINGFTVFLFQIPVSRFLTSKIRPLYGMSIGSFLYMSGYLLAGYANSIYAYAGILFCISLGEVFVMPLSQTSVAKLAPEKMIGRYMGLYAMTAVAGWSAGPYIGGKILEWVDFDFQIAWQIISLFALSAGVGYTLLDTTLRIRGSLREM
ncbi:MAG: MFS transporter [Leptospiraceae bacterium]|nr:MFS transporter [Leptospiraceae bacterium]